jgi:hypothetical protein
VTALSLDDVVALNALIVTAIGLSLAFGRRDRKNGPLDLGAPKRLTAADELQATQRKASALEKASLGSGRPRGVSLNGGQAARQVSGRRGGGSAYGSEALKRLEEQDLPAASRQLNVFFNWNGHTWDAYEVLGVPAGSSRESVIQAFHVARGKSPDSIAFLQAATDAILKSR